ncbi:hypothetical protein EP7_002029 [Isosphaeraceae bacterium EP7]
MPVVLLKNDYQAWLNPNATPDELMWLLKPLLPELMVGYPVGKARSIRPRWTVRSASIPPEPPVNATALARPYRISATIRPRP